MAETAPDITRPGRQDLDLGLGACSWVQLWCWLVVPFVVHRRLLKPNMCGSVARHAAGDFQTVVLRGM